ncbi:MAG: DUF4124 domain-containing protein [Casimicrobiaceae bacterium]
MGQRRNDSKATAAARGSVDAFWWASACALLLALALLAMGPAHAATYKWVDDKGVVHYTDKIPPEALNKGNVQLDKQGVTVKTTDPAPTAEQRKARAAEEARAQQLAKDRELIDRRDRALLATYTTESEIDLVRNRAVSTIDAQVQSSTAYSATLNKRKVELDTRKAALGDKPVPAVLETELTTIGTELAKQAELIAVKQKEIIVVTARYDADKKRWKELRAATEAALNGASNIMPTTAKQ